MSHRSQSDFSSRDPLNQAVILSQPPSSCSNSITFSQVGQQVSQISHHEAFFLETPPEFRDSEDYPFTRSFARRQHNEDELNEIRSDPGMTIRMPSFKRIKKQHRKTPQLRPIHPIDEEREEEREMVRTISKQTRKTLDCFQVE